MNNNTFTPSSENYSMYDKEAYIQKKKRQLEEAYDTIKYSLEELKRDSSFILDYLNVQSKFDKYTPRNALLIAKVYPQATQLKEIGKWLESGVSLKYKYPIKIVILDPSNRYQTKDGHIVKKYQAKEMVDISATNLKFKNKIYDKKLVLKAVLNMCSAEKKVVNSLENGKMCELNNEEGVIYICRTEKPDVSINAIINELAKADEYTFDYKIDEDNANCISYMVCKKYGIESSIDTSNICKKYSKMSSKEIITDLTAMANTLMALNNQIDEFFLENTKSKTYEYEKGKKMTEVLYER